MFSILPISRYVIEGNSMLPTLTAQTSVIGFNWHFLFSSPKINDLVVATVGNKTIIKRIKKIDHQKLWLEGDNMLESTDSRSFGWISQSQLIAKVIYKLD